MDYQEFAGKIRQKYPGSYDDLDDQTLAKKIVDKYPQYSDVTFDDSSQAGTKVSDTVRNVAQAAYAPFRATRALGVGAERLMQGVTPPILPSMSINPQQLTSNFANAAQRMKAAYQPGYQPQEGEKLGAFLGEAGGQTAAMAAATAPFGGVGAIPAAGRAVASALTTGGLTALQQASETGKVKVLPTAPKSAFDLIPDSVIGTSIFGGAMAALPEAVQAFRQGVKNVAQKVLPRTLAKTASIPERATQMAIDNPSSTKSIPNVEDQIHDQAQNVIRAVQEAKAGVGQALGKAYQKYAGIQNPIEGFIEGNQVQTAVHGLHSYPVTTEQIANKSMNVAGHSYQTTNVERPAVGSLIGSPTETPGSVNVPGHSYNTTEISYPQSLAQKSSVIDVRGENPAGKTLDDIRQSYKSALSGDLFKKQNPSTGAIESVPIKDRVGVLSQLKRDIQSQINFNKEPATLRPIDSVKDAALKKMASQVDDLRDTLPNGKKLSAVDRGWQAINDIYGQLQRDLSTPGKAEDTLMKLFKRDMSAITAGRTAEKIAALRRVESITGEKVLDPIFKSFTAREFDKAVGKGLSHTLMTGGGAVGAVGAALSGHPLVALGMGASMLAGSPKVAGLGIRGAAALGRGAQAVANSPGARSALIAALLSQRKKGTQ